MPHAGGCMPFTLTKSKTMITEMKKLFVSALALVATLSLSAQDLTALYNEASQNYNTKNYPAAIEGFQKLIDEGMDSEEAAAMVATAKQVLPKCYFMLGGAAAKAGNFEEAAAQFTKSADLADLYGDANQLAKSKMWVARVYQAQGGAAFNNKDYATAAEIFAKGYAADPRNTDMALNLAMSYCELAVAEGDLELYAKGMEIYENVAAMTAPKYAEAAAKAREMMGLYTNNMVARMQAAGNTEGILAMAESMLAKNPQNPVALKVRVQVYSDAKDYAKVIELAPEAAEAQPAEEDKSLVYLMLGAAYNAREMKPQAIAAFGKVTAGPALEPAKAALAELNK